jgi:hypothetical protein
MVRVEKRIRVSFAIILQGFASYLPAKPHYKEFPLCRLEFSGKKIIL